MYIHLSKSLLCLAKNTGQSHVLKKRAALMNSGRVSSVSLSVKRFASTHPLPMTTANKTMHHFCFGKKNVSWEIQMAEIQWRKNFEGLTA